jgi:hypothetical protein
MSEIVINVIDDFRRDVFERIGFIVSGGPFFLFEGL